VFLEPSQTPWDLRWRMFGIPVRVHPMFWLITVLMGWTTTKHGYAFLLIWIGAVFISILVHELGHVAAGMFFGSRGHIVLYGMGGLAIGSSNVPARWQRIVVSLAGPMAGFLFLGLLFLAFRLLEPARADAFVGQIGYFVGLRRPIADKYLLPTLTNEAVWDLIVINLFWGAVNLLPVYPLDGGWVSRDLFTGWMGSRGVRASLSLSLAVAVLVAVNALAAYNGHPLIPYLPGDLYVALLFGFFALGNFQELQQTGPPATSSRSGDSGRAPWERDPDYWK
jgi:stage IV sporulation protein FB